MESKVISPSAGKPIHYRYDDGLKQVPTVLCCANLLYHRLATELILMADYNAYGYIVPAVDESMIPKYE
jgi:hypothetical protein